MTRLPQPLSARLPCSPFLLACLMAASVQIAGCDDDGGATASDAGTPDEGLSTPDADPLVVEDAGIDDPDVGDLDMGGLPDRAPMPDMEMPGDAEPPAPDMTPDMAPPDLGPPPTEIEDLEVEILGKRAGQVALRFRQPLDTARYEIRRADEAIADEEDWIAAEGLLAADAEGADGDPVELVINGLPMNRQHALAIRRINAEDAPGPLVAFEVDLRLEQTVVGVPPGTEATWRAEPAFGNRDSLVAGLGDINGDGFDDALVTAVQYNGFQVYDRQAVIVLGGAGSVEVLEVPQIDDTPVEQLGIAGASVGDVNGDGLPDLALVGFAPDLSGGVVALYLGSRNSADLLTADALIRTPGRFVTRVTGLGDFVARPIDVMGEASFGDLAIGGAAAPQGSDFVYVIAGRSGQEWSGATLDASQVSPQLGVHRLVVGGTANAGASLASAGDLDGDGFTEAAFSTGAALDHNAVFVFSGGADLPGDYAFAQGSPSTRTLTPPCPGNDPLFGSFLAGGVDISGDEAMRPDLVVGDRRSQRIIPFDETLTPTDCFGNSADLFGVFFDFAGDVDANGATDLIATHVDPARTEAWIFLNDGLGRFGAGEAESPREAQLVLNDSGLRKLGVAGLGNFDGDEQGHDDVGLVVLTEEGALRLIVLH